MRARRAETICMITKWSLSLIRDQEWFIRKKQMIWSNNSDKKISETIRVKTEPVADCNALFFPPEVVLQQCAGHVTVLPAQTCGLGMFVQVRGLAETFPTLQTRIGLLSCVDSDVFLAVSQGEKSFAADLASIFPSPFHHQDVVLWQRLLAFRQDVGRRPCEVWWEGGGPSAVHLIPAAFIKKQRTSQAGGGGRGILKNPCYSFFSSHPWSHFWSDAPVTWITQTVCSCSSCSGWGAAQWMKAQTGPLEVQGKGIYTSPTPAGSPSTGSTVS